MYAMKSAPQAAPASEPVMVRITCCGQMVTMDEAWALLAQRRACCLSVRSFGWGMEHRSEFCEVLSHCDWMAVGS